MEQFIQQREKQYHKIKFQKNHLEEKLNDFLRGEDGDVVEEERGEDDFGEEEEKDAFDCDKVRDKNEFFSDD